MMTRRLGRSGLEVSPLCLGTMTFGEAASDQFMHGVGADEATSFAIMDRALAAGVNFFDTADVYGEDGLTERVIGRWFAERKQRRKVVLATKCRFRMEPGPNGSGASRRRIMEAVDASLRRLQTDYIDLYQIHMQDSHTPEEETMRALDDLVRAGKVLYLGASNYTAHRLMTSLWKSSELRLERYVALQMQYSLVERSIEREHVPVCLEHGLGILPWSPLASGLLTGKYDRDHAPPPGSRLAQWADTKRRLDVERSWKIVDALRDVASDHECSVSAVALAWLMAQPAVASVIFGARTVAQLESNLEAAKIELRAEDLARMAEASDSDPGYPYSFIKRIEG